MIITVVVVIVSITIDLKQNKNEINWGDWISTFYEQYSSSLNSKVTHFLREKWQNASVFILC